jgi:hypothetical protein
MSISKVSLSGLTSEPVTKLKRSKSITLTNTFLTSVLMLSALDLIVAFFRNDSLSNYIMFVLSDLVLTALGLIVSSDLIPEYDRESVKCFLAYMLFLWVCITVVKLIFPR